MIFTLALTNLRRNGLRTAFAAAGVVIAVAAYLAVSYYFAFVANRIPETPSLLPADIMVTFKIPAGDVVKLLNARTDVAFFEPVTVAPVATSLGLGEATGVVANSRFFPFGDMLDGRGPAVAGEVAISQALADAESVDIGGKVVLANGGYTAAVRREYTVCGIFSPRTWRYDCPALLAADLNLLSFGPARYMLRVADGANIERVAAALIALPEVTVVETARTVARAEADKAWQETWGQAQASAQILMTIVLVIAGLGVFNTMTVSMLQRRRELGILKAMGVKDGQVLALFAIEGAIMAGVAFAVGVGLYFSGLTALRALGRVSMVAAAPRALVYAGLLAAGVTLLPAIIPGAQCDASSPQELLAKR